MEGYGGWADGGIDLSSCQALFGDYVSQYERFGAAVQRDHWIPPLRRGVGVLLTSHQGTVFAQSGFLFWVFWESLGELLEFLVLSPFSKTNNTGSSNKFLCPMFQSPRLGSTNNDFQIET